METDPFSMLMRNIQLNYKKPQQKFEVDLENFDNYEKTVSSFKNIFGKDLENFNEES